MTAQFLDIAGQQMVVLSKEEFDQLCELAEDSADIRAAIAAEARHNAGEEYVPAALVDRLIAGESPLRVWREYRGFSQEALGLAVGLSKMTISGLESGKRDTNSKNWRRLSDALSVDVDDILPIDDQ